MNANEIRVEEVTKEDIELMEQLETVLAGGNCGGGCSMPW